MNWENGGEALRRYTKAILRNEQDYFKAGITWSLFGFENFAVRYKTEGFLFDVSGSSMFPQEEQTAELLGFLCSKRKTVGFPKKIGIVLKPVGILKDILLCKFI